MIWVLPGVVALLLAVPVALAVRRCAAEASSLRSEVGTLGELQGPVAALRRDVVALRTGVPAVRGRTRPGDAAAP